MVEEDWQAFQDRSKEISATLQAPSEECNRVGHEEVMRLIKERQRAAMRFISFFFYVAKRLHEMDGAQVFIVCVLRASQFEVVRINIVFRIQACVFKYWLQLLLVRARQPVRCKVLRIAAIRPVFS